MRLRGSPLAACVSAALFACTTAQASSPAGEEEQEPSPPEVADPMASFARLVGGEWWVGERGPTTWGWGPGKHSVHSPAGGPDAAGLEVYYWHPGRKQVCMLTMHGDIPGIGRGVGEGTIEFDGEIANGVFDLHQPPSRRKLGLRWVFDGPDKYRDSLLEATGPAGLQPLAEWDRSRSHTTTTAPSPVSGDTAEPPARWLSFRQLLGNRWEAQGRWADGRVLDAELRFEWVPSVEVVHARVLAPDTSGEPDPLVEAYVYHDIGTDALRCLALSNWGGVYAGDLTVLEGGALQFDLKGYAGDQALPYIVRFDLAEDGTLRDRVWSLAGGERTLLLDGQHLKLEPRED